MLRINPKYDLIVFHKQIMDAEPIGLMEEETYYFDFDKDCIYMYPSPDLGYKITRGSGGTYQMKSHVLTKKIANWFNQVGSFLMEIEKVPEEEAERKLEWRMKLKTKGEILL